MSDTSVGKEKQIMQNRPVGEKKMITYAGTVENIIYNNEENGYAVFDMSVEQADGDEMPSGGILTACGILPQIAVCQKITVSGEWMFSQNYGRQFRVAYFAQNLPADENEILRYLSGRTVKGIGPKTAAKIVKQYGTDTFDVLENHPEWLSRMPGISESKANEISKSFRSQFGVRTLMMFCRDYLSAAMSMKIYKKWGASAVEQVKANPYRLCEEFQGIGFERADKLAQSIGIAPDSEYRLMSGIRYVLSATERSGGHAFLPYDKLLGVSAATLGVEPDKVEKVLCQLIQEKRLYRLPIQGLDAVYDARSYLCEREIADKLTLIDRLCNRIDAGDVERFIEKIEVEEDKQYAALQRKAIAAAVSHGVMILTGGPGTGKTTVIRAVIRVFSSLKLKIALAAPTGRAAKRMSEATQQEAKTIHRLLEVDFSDDDSDSFKKNETDLLPEDVIIIDEASMIDMFLMNALLRAIKPGARVLFIGDSDQLPSVGAGNVLNDMITSERFCTVRLTEVFRQAEESMIVTNAHKINDGIYPTMNAKTGDFFFLPRMSDELTASTIVELWQKRLPASYGDIADSIQVISPSRRGIAGTESLNMMLQAALNPPSTGKKEKKFREVTFREGDRVMQIRNDYDLTWEREGKSGTGVFNGDIGIIESIHVDTEKMIILFDERIVSYEFTRLEELVHAWAITVHKSQGSEYPYVLLPMYNGIPPQLRTRNLLYTAVTRAKKMAILIGNPQIVCEMVDNNRQVMRYTGLFRGNENPSWRENNGKTADSEKCKTEDEAT